MQRVPFAWTGMQRDPFEIMAPIENLMNRLKSVLIVLAFLLSSLSGCIGEDSESESDETPILLSRSGSVEHNYCKLAPGQGSSNNSSDGCPTDDETIEDYWSAITNLTVINQSAGKGVKIHSESGVLWQVPAVVVLFGDGTLGLTMAILTTQQHIIKVT